MKSLHYIISTFIILSFLSCNKLDCKKDDDVKVCTLENSSVSTDNSYQDFYNWEESGVKQYVLEDIVVDPTCNCIVSGYIKYVKDKKTVALIKYGNGNCDSWAIKINCVDGSCSEEAGAYCTKFEQNCTTNDPEPIDVP